MKTFFKIGLIIAFTASLLISCSKEKLINEGSTDRDIIAATYDGNSHLARYKFPTGTKISDDLFYQSNHSYISANKVANIRLFLKYIFLCVPDDYKIYIIDKNNFTSVATIDFSQEQLMPTDIAFANATEGYAIFKNTPKVALIDVYYFKLAKMIDVKDIASSISAVGNQIFVAIPLQNDVSIIDSRIHDVVQDISVDNRPYLLYPNIDGKDMNVVTAGFGKIPGDPNNALSKPTLNIIDVQSRSIASSNLIDPPKADLTQELPSSFIVTNNDWGFLITQNYLIRIDTRNPQYAIRIEQYTYGGLYHNNIYNELYVLDNKDANTSVIRALDPITGKKLNYINISLPVLTYSTY